MQQKAANRFWQLAAFVYLNVIFDTSAVGAFYYFKIYKGGKSKAPKQSVSDDDEDEETEIEDPTMMKNPRLTILMNKETSPCEYGLVTYHRLYYQQTKNVDSLAK